MTAHPDIHFLNDDSDTQLIADTKKILKTMTGNANYLQPTPWLPMVTDAVNTFAIALADAADESNAMTDAKHAARGLLVNLLGQLASYVQVTSKGDVTILWSSGFPVQSDPSRLFSALPIPSYLAAFLGYSRAELFYAGATPA